MPRRHRILALSLSTALALSACSEGGSGAGTGGGTDEAGAAGTTDVVRVIASFYPLEYLAQRVAGEHAEVSTLTSPGVDPHDVELTPRTVASVGAADLVVYESGMQPAVDEAVEQQAPDRSFDVTPAADLLPVGTEDAGADHDGGAGHADHEAEEDHGSHSAEDGHDHGPADPHFWLDPERYGNVAVALAEQLSDVDPAHADAYAANAEAFVADLQALDRELQEGLAQCDSREVVTTHDAFGYLGARYDLHVTGITGISPDSEPSPARLAEVSRLVTDLGVTTVYAEPLLPPDIARTVATETGTQVLTLDPADGLSQAAGGSDYLEIMRANLVTLREGQGCS